MLTQEQRTVIELTRLGLGRGGEECAVPETVDWREVVRIAREQGVGAIACDGLHALYERHPGMKLALDGPELVEEKYNWFGQTLMLEQEFRSQWRAAVKLSELFAGSHLRTVVLKGFSLGRNYPNPEHRYSCDLDCFLLPEAGFDCPDPCEAGNRLVEAEGVRVDRSFYKNSSFDFKGLHVENHRFCTPVRGSRRKKRLERYLEGLLDTEVLTSVPKTHLLYAGPLFTALMMTEHAQHHFVNGGISLRHVLDWALFLDAFYEGLDMQEFRRVCEEHGMLRFADAITEVGDFVHGRCEFDGLSVPAGRMLEDLFRLAEYSEGHGRSKFASRVGMVFRALGSGWKYRLYGDQSMLGQLATWLSGFVFDRRPRV